MYPFFYAVYYIVASERRPHAGRMVGTNEPPGTFQGDSILKIVIPRTEVRER
jgi:hypothetical protein